MMTKALPFLLLAALASCSTPTTPCRSQPSVCAGNTPATRSQWCDFSVDTNYYETAPNTGVVREYHLELQELTLAPDGFPRTVYAFNGMIPGPTIEANWGDTVVVHVTNNLTAASNGTSVHWHGIRQLNTNEMDGVTAITQCPIAVGDTMTYKWRATQYGTSWYHSHTGLQAWDGAAGAISIKGPATANYDEDKGTVLLADWTHPTASSLYSYALTRGPPVADNGIINGTNTWNNNGTVVGKRFSTGLQAGKSYRFGIINGANNAHFKFSIDNHVMTVIAADFVPIVPFQTNVLDIAIGQRYDIIITANQQAVAQNFWMRAIAQKECSSNANPNDIQGIVYYGAAPDTPTTSPFDYTAGCVDEPVTSLVPRVVVPAGTPDLSTAQVSGIDNATGVFLWHLNETSFYADWNDPSLLQVHNNDLDFTTREHVIKVDEPEKWFYVVIHGTDPLPHPIHLHGHDFAIVAQGPNEFNWDTDLFSLANPMRRDVALMPPKGHLVLAFKTDNPGAWLMHCHIGWHTKAGFALQFLERQQETRIMTDYDFVNGNCQRWKEYAASADIEQYIYDDGI